MFDIITRRALITTAFVVATGGALAQSAAAPTSKFTQAAFDAAQAAGKSVIVEVSAPWCPTCKAQAPIINSLKAKPEFSGVTLLMVDFDSQKDVLQKLKVQTQSTLIAFKGKTETSRSVGETKANEIEKLFKSAI
jgi:thioredoxin 1